jgi:hypothetical protein
MAALPVPVLDEQRVVDRVADQVASVLHRMSTQYSRERLASLLHDALRRGDLLVTLNAIEAAERKHDWLADAVLRQTYAEMETNHEPMSDQLRAFGQRAVLRPPVVRKPGRTWHDNWNRDVGICTLIQITCIDYNIRPTRSRSARRDRIPSGCSLVKQALARNKIHIEEKTIQENIWLSLLGMLVRQSLSDQFDLGIPE